jgi:hypothetical protein
MVLTRTRTKTTFVVLTPSKLAVPGIFRRVETNTRRHDELFAEMQRFRGNVYHQDGAIEAHELTADGRHNLSVDQQSWHVLSLDSDGRVCACLRYADAKYARGFDDLSIRHSALAQCPTLGARFRDAVEQGMKQARRMKLSFGEVGGWAVAEAFRRTTEPLRIILATYGLLNLLGGSAGVATATFRHSSAMILRKIGLSSILTDGRELPPYFDPQYRCQMEVLQFDSRYPNPKYGDLVCELSADLLDAPVICRDFLPKTLHGVPAGFEVAAPPVFVRQLVHAGI